MHQRTAEVYTRRCTPRLQLATAVYDFGMWCVWSLLLCGKGFLNDLHMCTSAAALVLVLLLECEPNPFRRPLATRPPLSLSQGRDAAAPPRHVQGCRRTEEPGHASPQADTI